MGVEKTLNSAKSPAKAADEAAETAKWRPAHEPVQVKTVVKPVANAINILRYLGRSQRPNTATLIAKELGLNTSTCFNILRTLVKEGVVEFDPLSKTYKVGIGLLKLAKSVLSEGEHDSAARPYLRQFAEDHELTVCLWRRIGANRMILAAAEHNASDLGIHMRVGQRLPLFLGSTGRAMLPYLGLTKQDVKAEFKQLRWARQVSFESFWEQSQEAKKRGWALDDGDFSAGIITVSAPVFDPSGKPTHSVTAITFRGRFDKAQIAQLGERIVELSRHLSAVIN